MLRFLVTLGIALTVVGCGPTPSSTASASLRPSDAAQPEQSSCQDIDLRLPDGSPLDLTGTWLGNDDSYWTFSQVGGCVWATATDRRVVSGSPAYWQVFLRGTLQSDFTMPVEYAYSPLEDYLGAHYGHAVLSIEFGGADPSESMTLRKTAGCTGGEDDACPPGTGTLQTTVWALVRSTVILPPPTPEP